MPIARPTEPVLLRRQRERRFDPAHPGIVRWMRHPLLAALALWAIAHLVPNGDLAHGLVFGIFAAFALLGGRMVDRRKRRELDDWQRLLTDVQESAAIPRPSSCRAAAVRLALGIGLYLGLIWLHPWVLGVSPIP